MDPLSPSDLALLVLVKDTKKLVPDDSTREALSALATRGLLQAVLIGRAKAKQTAFVLSAEGKLALKPPKQPKQAKPRTAKPAPVTAVELAAVEARLLARIDQLERTLLGQGSAAPPVSAASRGHLDATVILTSIRDADRNGRHGGMVPIPEARKLALAQTGESRERFDAALLDLERAFQIDLKIANDPRRPDASEGIAVPGRGLVYFAIAR